jgi:VanZ family protein
MTPPAVKTPLRRLAAGALASYGVVLALLLLVPFGRVPSRVIAAVTRLALDAGVPETLATLSRVELGLNVLGFVPLTLLATLVWPRPTWRDWTAWTFVASFLVEAAQALVLSQRASANSDVVANTLGGLVGALLGALVLRQMPRRRGS